MGLNELNKAINNVLNKFSDQNLIQNTERLVQQECELLSEVLLHLKEIERRRLFSSLGYKSLFDFVVRKLGYSEDQAYRRISAMRLMKEIPQIEEKINSGAINLSHISIAQSFFQQEQNTTKQSLKKEEKLSLLESFENKSTRESQKIALSLSSADIVVKPDQIKPIANDKVELKFQADASLQEKIEKIKGLLAHKHPGVSLAELFEKLCDLGIEAWDPVQSTLIKAKNVNSASTDLPATFRKRCVKSAVSKAQVRHEVFKRAKHKCENCGSSYALEVDHIFPEGKGGKTISENLRLLCRACNQRAAIQHYGLKKMDFYINRSRTY